MKFHKFSKKRKAVLKEKERTEYEREYDEDFENDDFIEEEKTDNEEMVSAYNVDSDFLSKKGLSDELIALLRNAFFVERDDKSKDGAIAALTRYEMFQRLLELKHLYNVADYIIYIIKEIYGISLVSLESVQKTEPEIDELLDGLDEMRNDAIYNDAVPSDNCEEENLEEEIKEDMQNEIDVPEEKTEIGIPVETAVSENEMYDEMDEDTEEDDEIYDYILKVIDYEGKEKKYLLSEFTEEENLELLNMLVDANKDSHVKDIPAYLESLGAVIHSAEEYDDEDVYFIYDAAMNVVIDEIDEAV